MLNRRRLKDTTLGFLLVLAFILPIFWQKGFFDPIPYSHVDRTSIENLDDAGMLYSANFYKYTTCEFERLEVFGELLGEWVRLGYNVIPLQEDEVLPDGDRISGYQTLKIEIESSNTYNTYEIRTEHTCGKEGKRIPKIFDRFGYEDVQQGVESSAALIPRLFGSS